MDTAVGALALITLCAALVIGVFLFWRHNRNPKNREITKSVVEGDSSAHTGVRGGSKPDHMN